MLEMQDNLDPFVAALARLCEREGGHEAVAQAAGLSKDNLWQVLHGTRLPSGNPRGIGPKSRAAISSAFPSWLDREVGAREPTNEAAPMPNPTDDDFALVPQLDVSAACGPGYFVDHVVVKGGLAFKKSSLRDFGVPEGAARVIYASGGSMEPTIQDGCVVLINTADCTPREGRVYAICQPDGSLVLKRLVLDFVPAMGAQAWIMRSDNSNKALHPDKMLPPDDRTMIVGRAVWNDNRL